MIAVVVRYGDAHKRDFSSNPTDLDLINWRYPTKFRPTFALLYRYQPRAGVDIGPIHLVEAGLVDQLKGLGWKVEFGGHHQFEEIHVDQDPPAGIVKRPRLVSQVTKEVAQAVGAHIKAGRLPVTLGGDHSLAVGTVSGTLE